MSDANVHYLNHYLADLDRLERNEQYLDKIAQLEIENKNSKYWPWSWRGIQEAFCEIDIKELDRMARCYGDDAELAKVVREIVVGYWFNYAKDRLRYERR